jgi:hypothetical protein
MTKAVKQEQSSVQRNHRSDDRALVAGGTVALTGALTSTLLWEI